jgi:hypothetical protein
MPRSISLIAAAALLALCTPSQAADLPFVGSWDCGVATMSFTQDTYNNGSEDMPILETQEGSDGSWTLIFDGDYTITLSGFTGDSMGWMSSSGESLECTRVGVEGLARFDLRRGTAFRDPRKNARHEGQLPSTRFGTTALSTGRKSRDVPALTRARRSKRR